jgi:hypothetical protein
MNFYLDYIIFLKNHFLKINNLYFVLKYTLLEVLFTYKLIFLNPTNNLLCSLISSQSIFRTQNSQIFFFGRNSIKFYLKDKVFSFEFTYEIMNIVSILNKIKNIE